MIYEPTAAVIAYRLSEDLIEKIILIFNLDNDIPDITIMKVYNNQFTILFSQKNENLNGNKITDLLTDYLLKMFKIQNNLYDIDFYNENNKKEYSVIKRIKEECEKIKYFFSNERETYYIDLDSLYKEIDFSITIFPKILKDICKEFFQKYIIFLKQSLYQVNLEKKDINNIIIYGELSSIFYLREIIYEYFDGIKIMRGINSQELIAYGASIAAYSIKEILEFNENNSRLIKELQKIKKIISNERDKTKLNSTNTLINDNFFDLLDNKISNLESEINDFEIEQKYIKEEEKNEIIEEKNEIIGEKNLIIKKKMK